jgi:hypothetical protein
MLLKDRSVLERTAILSEISSSDESMSAFVRDVVLHEVGDRGDRLERELGQTVGTEKELAKQVAVTQLVARPARGTSKLRRARNASAAGLSEPDTAATESG